MHLPAVAMLVMYDVLYLEPSLLLYHETDFKKFD